MWHSSRIYLQKLQRFASSIHYHALQHHQHFQKTLALYSFAFLINFHWAQPHVLANALNWVPPPRLRLGSAPACLTQITNPEFNPEIDYLRRSQECKGVMAWNSMVVSGHPLPGDHHLCHWLDLLLELLPLPLTVYEICTWCWVWNRLGSAPPFWSFAWNSLQIWISSPCWAMMPQVEDPSNLYAEVTNRWFRHVAQKQTGQHHRTRPNLWALDYSTLDPTIENLRRMTPQVFAAQDRYVARYSIENSF